MSAPGGRRRHDLGSRTYKMGGRKERFSKQRGRRTGDDDDDDGDDGSGSDEGGPSQQQDALSTIPEEDIDMADFEFNSAEGGGGVTSSDADDQLEDSAMRGIDDGRDTPIEDRLPDDSDLESDAEEDDIVDLEDVRYGDVEGVVAHTVRSALDLDEVLGAAAYDEDIAEPPPISEAFEEPDEDEFVPDDEDTVDENEAAVDEAAMDEDDGVSEDADVDDPTRQATPAPVPQAQRHPQPPESRQASLDPEWEDSSTLLRMRQNRSIETTPFEKAFATYADLTGMSRQDYAAMREILSLVREKDGSVPSMIEALPKQLSTLKDRMRNRLPMMDMREADIPLNVLKMPTLPASLKPEERRKIEAMRAMADAKKAATVASRAATRAGRASGRDSDEARAAELSAQRARARAERSQREAEALIGDIDVDANIPKLSMKLTFFDPPTLFKNLVSSDIGSRIRSGPGDIVDNPKELYESHAWLSSVRATGGWFAHIPIPSNPDGDVSVGPAVFPSDWVYFRCENPDCDIQCADIEDDSDDIVDLHIGRVYGVGYDIREAPCSADTDNQELSLQIQEAHRVDSVALAGVHIDPAQEDTELILSVEPLVVPERKIYAHCAVHVDRHRGEEQRDPYWKPPKPRRRRPGEPPRRPRPPPAPFPKYRNARYAHIRDDEFFFAWRLVDTRGDVRVVPLCHTHPIRAELELEQWGRDVFEREWDQAQPTSKRIVSLPHLDFIDGFGVFRNSYRSLMGFYVTPAGLSWAERCGPGSIFPLVLGPHGSDFSDVIRAMKTMSQLDIGMDLEVAGELTRICAFPLCYVGDMPQQAENAGIKGPRATRFCRSCFTSTTITDPEETLSFDLVTHGRFHVQTMEMQYMLEHGLRNITEVKLYAKQWGMAESGRPALAKLSPALDLVLTRPADPAHSEFNGLVNLTHILLRDGILTGSSRNEYAMQLRAWPFPPGWNRLMSPIKHLASYKMSDHGRWIIIVPALLLQWLRVNHLSPEFVDKAAEAGIEDAVGLVVETVSAIATSTSVLMGTRVTKADRDNMAHIVLHARRLFNQLCVFASTTSAAAAAQRGSQAGSSQPDTPAGSAMGSPGGTQQSDDSPAEDGGQSQSRSKEPSGEYISDILRPNLHIGVHYPSLAEEYGLPVNVNVLTGENEHRGFKARVYETNYSNIEKVLLMKLNFQQTLRLVLLNAFLHDDPEITATMTGLYHSCPTLFRKVLSRGDRQELDSLVEEADHEIDIDQSADESHLSPTAINRIPIAEVLKGGPHAVNENRPLPSRAGPQLTSVEWRRLIRLAYEHDYGKAADYPAAFENRAIQWSRKFGFTDRDTNNRFTFSRNDYVQYRRTGDIEAHYGRVDHIFVLDNFNDRHIFVVLVPAKRTYTRHHLLGREVLEEQNDDPIIVGIPAIAPDCPYMVRVDGVGTLWIDWDIHTL